MTTVRVIVMKVLSHKEPGRTQWNLVRLAEINIVVPSFDKHSWPFIRQQSSTERDSVREEIGLRNESLIKYRVVHR